MTTTENLTDQLDALTDRELELEMRGIAWDHATRAFTWVGTDGERAELDAIRDAICNHPIIVAENRAMHGAEGRMR